MLQLRDSLRRLDSILKVAQKERTMSSLPVPYKLPVSLSVGSCVIIKGTPIDSFMLECSGMISAHCNLHLQDPNNNLASASLVAGTTDKGQWHTHLWLCPSNPAIICEDDASVQRCLPDLSVCLQLREMITLPHVKNPSC
ncbi:uncharacterized protein LGALS13P1 isoform X1 [Papio anubis]|uniref:uncharacterized protein LGALS13P1 isoform X1 n=1 Tax=Papio anubis TaxID=9555 RepID=UPI00083ED338|nr:uncharacterized protein LGALS13P1 isoform X1 [Papio anubis]